MSGNVIKFTPRNAAKDPDVVLEAAKGAYREVLVIGWDHDKKLDVRASLGLSMANTLLLMRLFDTWLLTGDYLSPNEEEIP